MFATSSLFLDCGFIIPQDKAFFCDEVTLTKKSGAFLITGFLKDESRFPQTVEVAIGVDRFYLIGSPQQMTGTPVSLTLAMMLPQCLQI